MRALVALGSNLGDRRASLEGGLAALARLGAVTPSPLRHGDPRRIRPGSRLPEHRGPAGDRREDPAALLEALLRAELALGRDRARGRNAPRTLDLDLVAVGGWRASGAGRRPADLALLGPELTLELPHPRARSGPS